MDRTLEQGSHNNMGNKMGAEPTLDVLLVTYNHEKFIQQALDSIAYQDFSGTKRIFVADDCSTDRTVDIIAEFAKTHEGVEYVFLPSASNIGITANYARGFAATKSGYVAVLEGDDYWSATNKLSKQVAFLEVHRECAACACNYYVYDESRLSHQLRVEGSDGFMLLTPRILIADNLIGNFSTCVYRREILQTLPPELFRITAYDWAVNICVSMRGVIGFLREPLSVYRQHDNGVWSSAETSEKLLAQLQLIPVYDSLTGGVFSEEFESLRRAIVTNPALDGLGRRGYLLRRLINATPIVVRRALRWCMPGRVVHAVKSAMY